MDAKLQKRLEIFERNNSIIMKKYWLKNIRLQVLCSFILSCADMDVNPELLDECREVLSNHFGCLSGARDNLELPLMASMAVSGAPERYAVKFKKTYECISEGSLLPGEFEMLAALILMDVPDAELQEKADRMKSIYKKMGKNHPLLTDSADKSSAAILTLSEKNEDMLLDDMEACFGILKEKFRLQGGKVQTMSALLATMDGTAADKCAKTVELCEKLKERKMNLSMSTALPIVAGLAAIDKPADEIAQGIGEIAEALKGKPGFGGLGLGAEGRIIYGITHYLACCCEFGPSAKSLLQTEILNAIIQEIILIMIIVTTA